MWFWLSLICGVPVVLLVLYVFGSALYAFVRFSRLPEVRWRNRVGKLWIQAQKLAEQERARMHEAGVSDAESDWSLAEEYFRRLLAQVSIHELDAYSGIGPVTINRLQEAGCATLADLYRRPLNIEGLGQKRLTDIQKAVEHLARQARSRFDAGACREAQELAERLVAVRAVRSEAGARALARFGAMLEVLHHLEPLMELAEKITFEAYMQRPKNAPFVMPAMMHRSLPDLEQALRNADDQARRQHAEVQLSMKTPTTPNTAAPVVHSAREAAVDLFQRALESAPATLPLPIPATSATPNVDAVSETFLSLLRMTVRLAWAVARADGQNVRKAKTIIDDYLRRRCGGERALFNRVQAVCTQEETASLDPAECLEQIVRLQGNDERQRILDLVSAVAASTGKRGPRAQKLLDRIGRRFGLASTTAVPAATEPTRAERLAALEIDPAAPLSADLVRRQYRLLQERFAPDKFQASGPDFVELANRKRGAAQEAAASFLEEWGEPLEEPAPPAEPALRHNPDLDAIFGD